MSKTIIANEPIDYFERKPGSKMWPSSDPNDSPVDTFTCKLCGWSFNERIYGSFPIHDDPWGRALRRMFEHLVIKHKNETSLKIRKKGK